MVPFSILHNALETVPRALSLMDRSEHSRTYGCCDRPYWHYRIQDFSNKRYQEAGLLLLLAYLLPHPENPFYEQHKLMEWVRAIWRFWLKSRNHDGSVEEVYPNERSFCATAFTAAAFIETIELSGGGVEWQEELSQLKTTMIWLHQHHNDVVCNQIAASWRALEGYARLTGDVYFQKAAQQRQVLFEGLVTEDGCFPEYGGLDIGYQSITMGMLTRIAVCRGGDSAIERMLQKSADLLACRVGEQGVMDVARNSRRTQYLYPYALSKLQHSVLERVMQGVKKGYILRPTWMDDRYCIALATDYLLLEFDR